MNAMHFYMTFLIPVEKPMGIKSPLEHAAFWKNAMDTGEKVPQNACTACSTFYNPD